MPKKDSIVKRLNVDSVHAYERLLASAQTINQLCEQVAELKNNKRALQAQRESLEGEICRLRARLEAAMPVIRTATTEQSVVPIEVPRSSSRTEAQPRESNHESEEHNSGGSSQRLQSSDSDSGSSQSSRVCQPRRRASKDPHPPGFRTLLQRVDKFSGHQGDDDFEIWLVDFKEATEHCGWQDKQRAKWFSGFLSGPAKATWQRTLKDSDKESWQSIVEIYRGQYGVHLDPRIAYQKCQELQYSQFGSAQGLLNAMRDYQRMAPEKLIDATVESILWNKVPIALQQELKEIPDGSVQELLQKLLWAETTLQERERRSKEARQ